MKIIFDATNIRSGGGIKHLINLQKHMGDFNHVNFEIYLSDNLSKIEYEHFSNCKIVYPWWSKYNPFFRTLLHQFFFYYFLKKSNPDFVIYPGSIIPLTCKKFNSICISQNMLPFCKSSERNFFNLKISLLRYLYMSSYKNSKLVFFLTSQSKKLVEKHTGLIKNFYIIPHAFNSKNEISKRITKYYEKDKFYKLIYVSPIISYKNQIKILESLNFLKTHFKEKFSIDFVGSGYGKYYTEFIDKLSKLRNEGYKLSYSGFIDYDNLKKIMLNYDASIFASSCETLPFTVLEIHENNIPLIISNISPMKDLFSDDILKFDPLSPSSISEAMVKFFSLNKYSYELSNFSLQLLNMTWKNHLNEILNILSNYKKNND